MQSKYHRTPMSDDESSSMIEELEKRAGQQGAPHRVVEDLVKHAANKITQVYQDTQELTETPWDGFKVASGIAFMSLCKFEGLLMELWPQTFQGLSRHDRIRGMGDLMYVMTANEEERAAFNKEQRAVQTLVSLLLNAKYDKTARGDEARAMLRSYRRKP